MRVHLFLLLILFSIATGFFWDDEEKQLRALHQSGETSFEKKEFEEAKKAYEELWHRIALPSKAGAQKYAVDWTTYVDIAVRLAACCDELDEPKEAEKVLALLLAKKPPEELLAPVKLMKARLAVMQCAPSEAYKELHALRSNLPIEHWPQRELSFFHALEHSLDSYYDELLSKAKRFLLAGFYKEAIPLYEEALTAIEKGCFPKVKSDDSLLAKKIRYYLAQAHFFSADYDKTLSCCKTHNGHDKPDREMIYLSALCYREQKEYEKALEQFENYTKSARMDELDHYDQALFEIGSYFFQKGQMVQARGYFGRLLSLKQYHRKSSQLAAFYLARICLDEHDLKTAQELLCHVANALPSNDPLQYECFYLQGLTAYALGNYAAGQTFFERSLPVKATKWSQQALYHLGWCFLHQGADTQKGQEMQKQMCQRAEECFSQLLKGTLREAALLSLGHLYLLKTRLFEESSGIIEDQLRDLASSFSLDGQIEALLLRAEFCKDYKEKEQLYVLATKDKFKSTARYSHAWYCRGFNHLQEGMIHPSDNTRFFELAAAAFEQSFLQAEKNDPQHAASILKLEAMANLYRNSPINSLALLEKLLLEYDQSADEKEETLYLRGLLASRLPDLSYYSLAESSLSQVIMNYPNGKYTQDSLYALATLYYTNGHYMKAKEAFITLASTYPQNAFAPIAWFWAAEAATFLGENAWEMRQHVYCDYPGNEWSAEAYFRQFAYAAYLEGIPEAITHLKEFKNHFPASPLLIPVSYLIGINETEFEKAKTAFENAIDAFGLYIQELGNKEPNSVYIQYRYEAALKLAALYLGVKGWWQECEKILSDCIDHFTQKDHPFCSYLKQNMPYPPLFEEAEFLLAQCYLKQGKELSAQKILTRMLIHYGEAGIRHSYYLSQVWQEQGKLALQCGDYTTALNCFEMAGESGNKLLSDEQKLMLWILESDAYKGKKDYGPAMRLLSRVINAEAASPLRLQAMYKRAELYELEGRPELAVRQLEATAKKGGEWARQAKEKLQVNYGIQ